MTGLVIRINPNNDQAYHNRGIGRLHLGDYRGAIEDFNQAIRISPNYAAAYYNRGLSRSQLGDRQEGITDIWQAAKLAQKQGNTALYQHVQKTIRRLQLPGLDLTD